MQSALLALALRQGPPLSVLMMTDAGIDLDDEFSLIMAAALERLGLIRLLGVSACLKPARERWRLVRGTLTELGYGRDLPDTVVGAGTGMIEKRNGEPVPTDDNCPYLAPLSGIRLADEVFVSILLDAPPQSITLVVQSGFTDALLLAVAHGRLLREKLREVVIMGGVMANPEGTGLLLENGLMVPDDANNNTFNYDAAQMFYTWCQQSGVPMVVTMRHAASRVAVPFSLYQVNARHASPIGTCMRNRQLPSLQLLWQRANAPAGSDERGPLPSNRNRAWYVTQFFGGVDPGISAHQSVEKYLREFNLYDPFNLLAALPQVRRELLQPQAATLHGVRHEVYGLTPTLHGVRRAKEVVGLMTSLIEYGITAASARLTA